MHTLCFFLEPAVIGFLNAVSCVLLPTRAPLHFFENTATCVGSSLAPPHCPLPPVQLTGFIPSALSLPGGIRCLWISLNQMFSSELILQVTLSWFLAPLFRQAPRRQCHPSLGSSWRPGWSFLKSMLCSNALSNLKNHVIHTVWTP